jgi:hypothetical protein
VFGREAKQLSHGTDPSSQGDNDNSSLAAVTPFSDSGAST